MKKFMEKHGKIVADIALKVVKSNVNSACMFVAHQPKLPEGAEKLRKY